MIFLGKYKVLDTTITACDYEYITSQIHQTIKNKNSLLISPLASHTLVKAHFDKKLRKVLESFDYLVPDSQWVKRSIGFLHNIHLKERVYGPDLMLKTCKLAAKNSYPIFLYGSTKGTLKKLENKLTTYFPRLIIKTEPSVFRTLTPTEEDILIHSIQKNRVQIIFIGIGSPQQEEFSVKLATKMNKIPHIIIPVGAAFDFISKNKNQAPLWMQQSGFEWLFRLLKEPRRLWRRYVFYGVLFVFLIIKQKITQEI